MRGGWGDSGWGTEDDFGDDFGDGHGTRREGIMVATGRESNDKIDDKMRVELAVGRGMGRLRLQLRLF